MILQNRKKVAGGEVFLMLLSVFAFAFIVSIPETSANPFLPTGCCEEAKTGEQCLDMLFVDEGRCEDGLIATSCSEVADCREGCCYNSEEGLCSLNSPKSVCENHQILPGSRASR